MTTMIVDDLGRIPMSPYLTATLTRAADYASAQSHREVTLEHMLLALAEDPEATVVLKSSNIDLARLTADVSDCLGRSDDRVDPASGQSIAISSDLRRILEAAAAAARQGRRREINGAIVLAAIVGDGRSTAAHLLRVQGLTFEEAIRALQRATPAPPQPPAPQPSPTLPQAPQHRPEPEPERQVQQPQPPPAPDPGSMMPAPPNLSRNASTEEILASARERLQSRPPADIHDATSPAPAQHLPRANYPDLGGPPTRTPPSPPATPYPAPAEAAFEQEHTAPAETAFWDDGRPGPADVERHGYAPPGAPLPHPAPPPVSASQHGDAPPQRPGPQATSRWPQPQPRPPEAPRTAPPHQSPERRRAGTGPFVGSWPLVEAGQLVENIPRRMRVGVPVVVEARIARADIKAVAEGLAGDGAAFRHEIVVTKAMSVRLRAPDGGFVIENRSPETQWIENVLGFGSDDYASWRWTVTPRTRGRRQIQLIVSARTVGADGTTAETALPDQVVDVKVAINYARTLARWSGWIAAAVIGGLLAKFGETGFLVLRLLAAKHLGI